MHLSAAPHLVRYHSYFPLVCVLPGRFTLGSPPPNMTSTASQTEQYIHTNSINSFLHSSHTTQSTPFNTIPFPLPSTPSHPSLHTDRNDHKLYFIQEKKNKGGGKVIRFSSIIIPLPSPLLPPNPAAPAAAPLLVTDDCRPVTYPRIPVLSGLPPPVLRRRH